jgi:glycerophosphoryl diester phosphodiesterase
MAQSPSWPQVVAHRGAAAWAPEHTVGSYLEAIDEGAEALECDVRLTVDGHLVCVHDGRIDRTSDGTGRVSNKTLSQLQEHDFAAWWTGDAEPPGAADPRRDTVLTLGELLQLVVDSPQRLELAIETKHPTRYGGMAEQALVRELRRFGLYRPSRPTTQVRVMSFSSAAMRRMRDLAPGVPTVYLMERTPRLLRAGQLPYEARAAGPSVEIVRTQPDVVKLWQQRGLGVHVWTVDSRDALEVCMRAGVDAVISNRPGDVLRWRQECWAEFGAGEPAPAGR